MQTMPEKNRRLVTIGAILVGAVVLGALTFVAFNRNGENPAAQNGPSTVANTGANADAGAPVNSITSPATQLDPALEDEAADAAAGENAAAVPQENQGETADTAGASDAVSGSLTVPATHVVAPGETLRDISQKYYGDPVYAGDIEALNQLEDPNQIMVGQILELPRPEDLQ